MELEVGKLVKLTDAEIDGIINDELNKMVKKGGLKKTWDENILIVRHSVIIDYIRKGLSRKRCVEEMIKRWDITFQSAYSWYNQAVKYLGEINAGEDLGAVKQKQIERLEKLAETAMERNNLNGVARALDQINKINGLYTENTNVNVDGEIRFEFD
ncbi:MAG: hypothetical protein IJH39_04120 [Clostridia bacterium]|nr:hypothetical protein [Clostridia bacterium]